MALHFNRERKLRKFFMNSQLLAPEYWSISVAMNESNNAIAREISRPDSSAYTSN